jgi:hypothetical protein
MPSSRRDSFYFSAAYFVSLGAAIFLRDDLEQVEELPSYPPNRIRTGAQTGQDDAVKLKSMA